MTSAKVTCAALSSLKQYQLIQVDHSAKTCFGPWPCPFKQYFLNWEDFLIGLSSFACSLNRNPVIRMSQLWGGWDDKTEVGSDSSAASFFLCPCCQQVGQQTSGAAGVYRRSLLMAYELLLQQEWLSYVEKILVVFLSFKYQFYQIISKNKQTYGFLFNEEGKEKWDLL